MCKRGFKTAGYRVIADERGNSYRFFCDLSGAAICTTRPVSAHTVDEELELAWEKEGRSYFNKCARCGKWVCNAMFNADVLECVECTPWEDVPKYCSQCGKKVSENQVNCPECGARLRYGGV